MKKLFILGTFLFISSIPMVSCTDDDDKDPNFMPPDIVMGGGDVESEYPEDLPAPGASVMYTPSLNANMYRPISVKYSSAYRLYLVGKQRIHVLLRIWTGISRLLKR